MQMNEFVLSSLAPWRKERRLTGIVIAARWADGMGKTSLSLMDQSHFKLGEYYDRRASSQDDAIARFSGSLETLVDTTKKQGINVLIILPNPVQRYSAQHCLALKSEEECFVGLEATRNYSAEIENAIKAIANENSNLHVLDPKSFMCDSIRCPVVLNNRIVYSDDDHVTRSFSLAIANEFSEEIKWLSGEKTLE